MYGGSKRKSGTQAYWESKTTPIPLLHVTIQLPRKDEFACAATAARIQAPVCVVPYLQELWDGVGRNVSL
jgi:hypothetical protein